MQFVWFTEQPRKNPDLVKGQNTELKQNNSTEGLLQEWKNGINAEFYTKKQKHKRFLFIIDGSTRLPTNWKKEAAYPRQLQMSSLSVS